MASKALMFWRTISICSMKKVSAKSADPTGVPKSRKPDVSSVGDVVVEAAVLVTEKMAMVFSTSVARAGSIARKVGRIELPL